MVLTVIQMKNLIYKAHIAMCLLYSEYLRSIIINQVFKDFISTKMIYPFVGYDCVIHRSGTMIFSWSRIAKFSDKTLWFGLAGLYRLIYKYAKTKVYF